jgi:hypothetical protein
MFCEEVFIFAPILSIKSVEYNLKIPLRRHTYIDVLSNMLCYDTRKPV